LKYFRALLDFVQVLVTGSSAWKVRWAVCKALWQLKRVPNDASEADFYFLSHPFTVSDASDSQFVLKEIWLEQPYRLPAGLSISSIADVGANAAVHAFEPDARNSELLEKNTAALRSEKDSINRAAVWFEDTTLFANNTAALPSNQSFVAMDAASPGPGVQAIDFAAWIRIHKPDLVKMDIEGAEAQVLPKLIANGAAGFVPNWLVEFHPGTYGEQIEREISAGFEKLGFRVEQRGIIRFYSKIIAA
jgi:FkbM family methyltransferase